MRHAEILLVAIALAACHLASPRAFRLRESAREIATSASGGLASGYAFLHLLPEIDEEGALLGPRIYFVLLVGFTLYYGLEVLIHRTRTRDENHGADAALHLGAAALYSALLVFTLGQQLPATPALTAVFTASMGAHLISNDAGLQERYGDLFVRRGRFVLVGAVLLGYLLSLVREPREEVVDVLTALLAGSMIFTIFRKELPDFRETHLRAFLAGMGLFLVAHLLLSGG